MKHKFILLIYLPTLGLISCQQIQQKTKPETQITSNQDTYIPKAGNPSEKQQIISAQWDQKNNDYKLAPIEGNRIVRFPNFDIRLASVNNHLSEIPAIKHKLTPIPISSWSATFSIIDKTGNIDSQISWSSNSGDSAKFTYNKKEYSFAAERKPSENGNLHIYISQKNSL